MDAATLRKRRIHVGLYPQDLERIERVKGSREDRTAFIEQAILLLCEEREGKRRRMVDLGA
jgi:hypothetical protein